MINNNTTNKRIAKNTLMLYVRMFLIMGVSLYTSRVVLNQLGVEDFGIYNIIGGVVVLFTIINNAMIASPQRFLNFELGKQDLLNAQKVFSTSINIHLLIVVIFIILAESIGLWFVNNYINIPYGKLHAANWVYQFSIITTSLNIIRAPYNAAIIAHERMSAYAYISIIEAILKLAVVGLLILSTNKLIVYAGLITAITLLIFLSFYIYCNRSFCICHYIKTYEKERYKSMLNFSGWSLFGSIANMGAGQGLNIILNIYFGVGVNAAMGIANQVSSAVYQFVGNFQTAFNPQIIKSYALHELDYFKTLILHTSKYSYFLLYVLSLPLIICTPDILQLWLGQIPDYSTNFCRLMMVFLLIDAIQGPLWVSAQATGKIKNYQLIVSSLILLNLPLSLIILHYFKIAELALVIRVIINGITAIARVLYLRKLYSFPIKRYLKEVVFICLLVSLLSSVLPISVYICIDNTIPRIIAVCLISILLSCLCIYYIGLRKQEKAFIKTVIYKQLRIRI